MAAETVKSEIWAHLFSFKASFSKFQGLNWYFYWLQCIYQILRFFCIWPKIGQILFFSTILDYNLTKSPTYFIFGGYAVGGIPNFMLVFEKNRSGRFKVIRTWFFLFLQNHIKRFNLTLKLVFIYFFLVVNFANYGLFELVLKRLEKKTKT